MNILIEERDEGKCVEKITRQEVQKIEPLQRGDLWATSFKRSKESKIWNGRSSALEWESDNQN